MPEIAEVRITADYVNTLSEGKNFYTINKNPVHKGIDIVPYDTPFKINARSRGKELCIFLSTDNGTHSLKMTMGMSGHFKWIQNGELEKHAHLKFNSDEGSLAFVDVRRFGKWKWGEFSENRGPDPIDEYDKFIENILSNLHRKEFQKPLYEILMNQRYFNGIGNYLRAEILYKSDQNPFEPAYTALTHNTKILELCRTLPMQAYFLNGGTIKDWKNPFGEQSSSHWMKCYGNKNMATLVDSAGRRLWFDKKWL